MRVAADIHVGRSCRARTVRALLLTEALLRTGFWSQWCAPPPPAANLCEIQCCMYRGVCAVVQPAFVVDVGTRTLGGAFTGNIFFLVNARRCRRGCSWLPVLLKTVVVGPGARFTFRQAARFSEYHGTCASFGGLFRHRTFRNACHFGFLRENTVPPLGTLHDRACGRSGVTVDWEFLSRFQTRSAAGARPGGIYSG